MYRLILKEKWVRAMLRRTIIKNDKNIMDLTSRV